MLVNGVMVGCGIDCILLIDDDYVFIYYVEFSLGIDGVWFVEDLVLINGIYVNGECIENLMCLLVGDEV